VKELRTIVISGRNAADCNLDQPVAQSRIDWSTRLELVSAIGDSDQRDEAYAKVARDASEAGEVAAVQTAVDGIEDSDQRDETAAACVANLAKAGKHAEAIEIANAIADNDQRDETLARLATG
jgi:hypothetical protein